MAETTMTEITESQLAQITQKKNREEHDKVRKPLNKVFTIQDQFIYTVNDAKAEALKYAKYIMDNVDTIVDKDTTMFAMNEQFIMGYGKTAQSTNYPESESLNTTPITYWIPSSGKLESFVYDIQQKTYINCKS